MSKAVLLSIQPYYVFLIIAKAMGWNIEKEKTVEVRKNYPKAENWDRTVKIYCSKDKKSFAIIPKEYQPLMQPLLGKVIGEFVCNPIDTYDDDTIHAFSHEDYSKWNDFDLYNSCVHPEDFEHYANDNWLCGWHISDLVIYDEPKELGEFYTVDNEAVKQCEHRERVYTNPIFTNNALLLGSYICNKNEANWCAKCKTKPLTRPPQSWCYVEVLENG